MLRWLRRRREKLERIEAEANALIIGLGVEACAQARQRELEASSDAMAREWNRIAFVIARKTSTRFGLDTAIRMTADADFSLLLEAFFISESASSGAWSGR